MMGSQNVLICRYLSEDVPEMSQDVRASYPRRRNGGLWDEANPYNSPGFRRSVDVLGRLQHI